MKIDLRQPSSTLSSRAIPKMFPSVCQDVRAKMSALSFTTEPASVLFERWYLDIEELQTHHTQQFLVMLQRRHVTNIRFGLGQLRKLGRHESRHKPQVVRFVLRF